MKKWKMIPVILGLTLSLCACGQNTEAPAPAAPAAKEAAKDASPAPADAKEASTDDAKNDNAESIGQVYFSPGSDGINMMLGSTVMHVYFERADVIGAGKLTIMNKDTKAVAQELDLSTATEAVSADTVQKQLGWDNGTHLWINLDRPLDRGYDYYITCEEGAFATKDGSIQSKAISDPTMIAFGMCDYGIELKTPNGEHVYVGDHLDATVYVEGEAKEAVIEDYDENRVRLGDKKFDSTKETEIKIYQIGEDSFTVSFYDNNHDLLGKIAVSYEAEMPPEPESEVPERTTVGM
ncbi:MAG: hypothetical protein K5641_01745 [Lachnospiraceae bacterium]|nr:hypothetical protein [Lachnospiraceae bacterium]